MVRAQSQRERGASTAEYAGLVVLAALILGVVVPLVSGNLRDHLAYTLCTIFTGGRPGACEAPEAKRYKPGGCTLASSTNTYGGQVDVAFFQVGKDLTFMRTTTVDNNGKKTVTVTAVDNTSAGVGTGIGAGGHWKGANAGADATAAANLKLGIGDAWTFTGENPEQKANAFIGDIREKAALNAAGRTTIGFVPAHLYDAVAGPDIRDPDVKRFEFSVNGSGSIAAGLGLGPKDKKSAKPASAKPTSWKKRFAEKYDKRGSNGLTPNFNGYVTVDGSEKGVIEVGKNGETSATIMLSGTGAAGENHVLGGNRGTRGYTGSVKVIKDRYGRITSLDLTRMTYKGGTAQTVTTHVPITDNAGQEAVRNYLFSDLMTKEGQTALNLTWDDLAPTDPPGPDATPLEKLLYAKGRTTKQDYTYDSSQNDFGLNVKAGLKLGLGVSAGGANQRLTGAQYLGAPGADGVRRYQNYRECHQ